VLLVPGIIITRDEAVEPGFPDRLHLISVLVKHCPSWLGYLLLIIFLYTVINFALFLGVSTVVEGPEADKDVVLRGFTGHWVLVYYIDFLLAYTALRRSMGSSLKK